jgi:hypothetical protein
MAGTARDDRGRAISARAQACKRVELNLSVSFQKQVRVY